ncbi:hypothetical protein AGMMS49992_30510 [Clostridia bacterium]|nr:hypothetical protein AGMMS49992_30510 [Clostridia bacterium]
MMKIKYNDVINERQAVAEEYAVRMDTEAKYEKSSKCYVVGKVRFLKHGMVEGLRTRKQVDELTEVLKDWEFTDQESKAEYDSLPVEEPANPVSMTISIPIEGLTDDIITVLTQLVVSHYWLMQKALGADDLSTYKVGDELQFPWFRYPADNEEQTAYYALVNHLVEKAKTSKIVYDPVKGEEKYVFSRFLYRLGIDGSSRKTRAILMRNLDGSAWKNLTYKKKKAKRALAKGA